MLTTIIVVGRNVEDLYTLLLIQLKKALNKSPSSDRERKGTWRLLIPTCQWFRPASHRAAPVPLPRSPSASRSRNGTPSHSGLGVFLFSLNPNFSPFFFSSFWGFTVFLFFFADIVVDNCAICRNHIMDLCKLVLSIENCCSIWSDSFRFWNFGHWF